MYVDAVVTELFVAIPAAVVNSHRTISTLAN